MLVPRSTSKPSGNALGQSVMSKGMSEGMSAGMSAGMSEGMSEGTSAGTPESPTGGMEDTTAAPPGSGWQRWSLSLALMVSLMVGFYDRNNITFALTDIAREMGW